MKKSLLICGSLLIAAMAQEASAQLALQNFNSTTLPASWVFINDGHTVSTTYQSAAIQTALNANAWAPVLFNTGDYCLITTSKFTPTATADRWAITPSFKVTNANTILKWDDYNLGSAEKMQILVSTTAGTTAADFTSAPLYNQAAGSNGMVTHGLPIGQFNGQTIRLAFRENNTNIFGMLLDNVSTAIVPTVDASLTVVSPTAGAPNAYALVNSGITIKGTVKNEGITTLTSFVIKYQQGTGTVQSYTVSGVSIPLYGSYNFTHNVPFAPAAVGSYPVKVWVEATGDANAANNTINTTLNGVPRMPAKRLVVEEGTGTWCGWCVRGIVFMDSLEKLHPDNVSLVAVHNGDPMVVSAYDTWMGKEISGYPSVLIDRREVADPSDIIDAYNEQKGYFGFADVMLGKSTKTATTFTMPVTVKPAINMSGDYRLVMVMTEDGVTGTASGYDQHNYYSSTSQNQPLSGGGVNYQTSPSTIPAAQMHYNFVARDISPSATGSAGVLPATMTADNTYTATLTGTLNSSWNTAKMRATVLLVNNADGSVLNSNTTFRWTLGVSNTQVGVEGLRVFPNPAQETAQVAFSLLQPSAVQVQVVDALGRVVSAQSQNMTAGAQSVRINVASLSAGVYNVVVRTENGNITERLSVVK